MKSLDRQVRNEAVPVRGSVFGHNYKDATEFNLKEGAFTFGGCYSDLCSILGVNTITGANITPVPAGFNSFRILHPHYGELVECYIDHFRIHFPFNSEGLPGKHSPGSNDIQFGIGDFINNDFSTPRTSYTQQEISTSWKVISGRDYGYSVMGGGDARVYASRINLLPALYKKGHPKFVEDGFNLILMINLGQGTEATQGGTDTFALEYLRIAMSTTGIK